MISINMSEYFWYCVLNQNINKNRKKSKYFWQKNAMRGAVQYFATSVIAPNTVLNKKYKGRIFWDAHRTKTKLWNITIFDMKKINVKMNKIFVYYLSFEYILVVGAATRAG